MPDQAAQRWRFNAVTGQTNTYRIYHKGTNTYLDAYETSSNDYRVVLRPAQKNDTQKWRIHDDGPGDGVRLIQVSSERYLDSYFGSNDEQFVTRAQENNSPTQAFFLFDLNDPTPQVDSCMHWDRSGSDDSCEIGTNCQVPEGSFVVDCTRSGAETSCDCYNNQTNQVTTTTVSAEPFDACDEVLPACIAQ